MLGSLGFECMRWEVIISLVGLAALAVNAEEAPSQRPAPVQDGDEMDEPALPTSEAAPSNPEPGLLPGSGELLARPPVVESPKPLSTGTLTRGAPAEAARFEAIHNLAMGDLRATRLLRRARQSSNAASRRSYLRAYYTAVASRMRQLDPKLKSSINAYEEGKLGELSSVKSSTARSSSHRSRIHRPTRLAGHHRWHKYTEEHRYRRFIIIDAPYGPYGTEFPPYGPPIVFEPR
jgi:hypothetical protein